MTHSFRLTARARKELVSIRCCTSKRWGKAQRDRYLAALDDRFRWLAENPRVGRARPEIGNDVYSFREGAHVVFHVVRETRSTSWASLTRRWTSPPISQTAAGDAAPLDRTGADADRP